LLFPSFAEEDHMHKGLLFGSLVIAATAACSGSGESLGDGTEDVTASHPLLCEVDGRSDVNGNPANVSFAVFIQSKGSKYEVRAPAYTPDETKDGFFGDLVGTGFTGASGTTSATVNGGSITAKGEFGSSLKLTLDAPKVGKAPTTGHMTVSGRADLKIDGPLTCSADAALAANRCNAASLKAAIDASNKQQAGAIDDGGSNTVRMEPTSGGFLISYNAQVLNDRDHDTWLVVMDTSGGKCTVKTTKIVDSFD
jgi:hypothetical protein